MRKLKDEQKRNEVSAQGHGGPADLESGALDAEAAHPVYLPYLTASLFMPLICDLCSSLHDG